MSQKRIIIYIYIIIISLYIFSLFFILPGKKGFPPKVENGFLDLRDFNFDKTKYIILDNGWEFYWDKLLESADFTSEETLQPDGYTSIPSIWKELQVNGKNFSSTGYATYRINLLTNIDKKEWGILLKDFGSAVKVFINDKEITEIGKVSSTIENAIPLYNPRFVPFEAQDTVQIIVHVSNYHHRKGGFWHPPQIGPINNIRKAFLKIRFLTIFLLGSIFIIGLYHFILFIYNKQKYTPLFFGLFCIALFFRISAVNDYIISEIPGITFQKIVFFEYNSMFLAIVFFALYIYSLYPEVFHKRIIYVVIALQAIFILITLFTKTLFYTNLIIPFVYVLVLSAIYALYILIKAVLLKKDSAELFLLGFIVLLLTVMNDILNNVFVIQSVDIVSIGLFLFILIQTIALSYRYSLAFQRTDELTKELNNKNVHLEKLLSDYEKINKELTEKNEKIIVKNREIKKAKEKAVESDRLKSAFLANMSHEIRTPLNGILGFAELLKSSYYTDKRKEEFVDIINSNGNYLLSLINDIIDIAKIEAEQLKITYNSFNLIQLLAELKTVTESDKIFKEKKELLLTLDNDVKNRFFIQTDKTRLRQIIWNLLMNAVKFTNKGQINFGYELKPNNTLLFYVIDTGIGIPLDKQKLIFERFTQAHEQTVKELGGTGLGLTISKGLVNLLGGEIWVKSESGKGTAFYFTLPHIHGDKKELEEDTTEKADIDLDLSGKTILVAEDEETNFKLLENILIPTKAKIIHVITGKDAVEYSVGNNIDLILMDIKLPELDGFEATKQIKAQKDIPIIAITAYAADEDREKAINAGCDKFISKPISSKKLKNQIFFIFNPAEK